MDQAPDVSRTPSEMKLTDLPLGEQFVLWAARLWVKSQHFAPTLHLNLRDGFRSAHIEEGYLVLDRIMTLLSMQAIQNILFRDTDCSAMTGDEQLLLGVFADFQTGDEDKAHLILSDWFSSETAHMAGCEFKNFAMLLKENGLHIRERQWFSIDFENSRAPVLRLPNVH